jgi:hypothetical protein
MDNSRVAAAINLLRQCKAQGKSYYEATELLQRQGYSQTEIEQASDQFPYTSVAIPRADDSTPSNPTPGQLANYGIDSKEVELKAAKQKLWKDYWYQFIPFVGTFYKARKIGDFTTYESLKTGKKRTTVLLIWVGVMLIAMALALTSPSWLMNSTWGLYAWHYVGVLAAILLLSVIFRARNNG